MQEINTDNVVVQPICSVCIITQDSKILHKSTTIDEGPQPIENCCFCGQDTTSGLFVTVRVRDVKFATIAARDAIMATCKKELNKRYGK